MSLPVAIATAIFAAAQANADLARITANDPYGTKYTSKSSASSSGSSSGSSMTLNQAQEALDNGFVTPGAVSTWESAHGTSWYSMHPEDVPKNMTESSDPQWRATGLLINSIESQLQSNGGANDKTIKNILSRLNTAANSGQITDSQLLYICDLFGIGIG